MPIIIPNLVSTIIPVYNRVVLLKEAVQSVLDQTYRPIEIIIVDDESTDDTPKCIGALKTSFPDIIRSSRQRNSGPGIARETGRTVAQGEFIQYLDSDDVLLPDKFKMQVAALRADTSAGAAYCWTRYRTLGEPAHPAPWKGSGQTRSAMFPSFLDDRWWDTPTPLYRRSVTDAAGPWTDLRLEEDWEYDCRIASLGTKLVHCREYLVEVRDHAGPRLCRGKALDASRLKIRARSHRLIFHHAIRAGLTHEVPEMQRFSRRLFLLARQCGAAGLGCQASELFELAKLSCGPHRASGADFITYSFLTKYLGWFVMGRAGLLLDWLRSRIPLGEHKPSSVSS